MSQKELEQELERLRAENAAMKARATAKLTFKVGEKGGIMILGLQRFPVTLYREQWEAVLNRADDLRAFIAENDAQLKRKAA